MSKQFTNEEFRHLLNLCKQIVALDTEDREMFEAMLWAHDFVKAGGMKAFEGLKKELIGEMEKIENAANN